MPPPNAAAKEEPQSGDHVAVDRYGSYIQAVQVAGQSLKWSACVKQRGGRIECLGVFASEPDARAAIANYIHASPPPGSTEPHFFAGAELHYSSGLNAETAQ